MKRILTSFLLLIAFQAIGQTNVTPEAWLALQSKPAFKAGHRLPKLTRYGWPWTFDLLRELGTNWGFYLEVNGSADLSSTNNLAAALADTNSTTFKVVSLASNLPSVYQLQVNLERAWPTNMSRGFFVTNSAGLFVDTATNTWSDWTNATFTKVVSPEAGTNDLATQAKAIVGPLRMLAGMAPIGMVVNGGERDLGVSGYDWKAWQFDPRVQATAVITNRFDYFTNATGLSWARYASAQKARHLRAMTVEVAGALTNANPAFLWYNTGNEFNRFKQPGYDWENDWANWGWLSTNLINVSSNPAVPIANSEVYFITPSSFTNATGAAWNNYTDLLTHQLGWAGYVQGLGWRTNYSWICGGWSNTHTNRLADLTRYMGLLKMLIVSGSVGWNVGYYEFPTNTSPGSIFGNDGFAGSFPTNSPPHWLQQVAVSSHAHAFASHIDDFLLNSSLLPGDGAHFASTDAASCEFTNTIADLTLRVIARKRDGRPEWLVGAWASYGAARSVTVNLPTYGSLSVTGRPGGSVYWVTPDTVRLLDVNETTPSLGVQTPDVVPSYRKIDWATWTGLEGGIPYYSTVYSNMAGLDATGTTDVSADLQAALNACPSNAVVKLPAGTFLITNTVAISTSGTVLRGSGTNSTRILLRRPSQRSDGGIRIGSATDLGITGMWTNAGLALRGQTNLTLLTATGIAVGNILAIEQINDTNVWYNLSQDGGSGAQDFHNTTSATNYIQMQLLQVESVSSTNITFSPPLINTWTNSLNCRLVKRGANNWPRLCGLEDLTVVATNIGSSFMQNVRLGFADRCWVSNVVSIECDKYHIYSTPSFRCQVFGSMVKSTSGGGSGGNYGIGWVFGSGFGRIENNISENTITLLVLGEMAHGNVVAYNYEGHNYYSPTNWLQPFLSAHDCGTELNLWEGNVGGIFGSDIAHGNSHTNTIYRNWLRSWQPYVIGAVGSGVQTNGTTSQNGSFIDNWNNYYSVVGNVFGGTWQNWWSVTNGPVGSVVISTTNVLLKLGYTTGLPATFTNTAACSNTVATMLLAGNWYRNTTDVAPGVPSGQAYSGTLPASLYLTSKPAWFGALAWPPIGPDVAASTVAAYDDRLIPAQYRYAGLSLPGDPSPPPPEGGATFRSVEMRVGTLRFQP